MTSETKDTTYNGWHNYETWSVALIVDNERGLYEQRRYMARERWETANDDTVRPTYFTRSDAARYAFADALKAWVTDSTQARIEGYGDDDGNPSGPDDFSMLASQLVGAALSEVDWTEIADNWLNEEINENGDGGYEDDDTRLKREKAARS